MPTYNGPDVDMLQGILYWTVTLKLCHTTTEWITSFSSSNAYGVFIAQNLRYALTMLIIVLMFYSEDQKPTNNCSKQEHYMEILILSVRKFYWLYKDLIKQYEVSSSEDELNHGTYPMMPSFDQKSSSSWPCTWTFLLNKIFILYWICDETTRDPFSFWHLIMLHLGLTYGVFFFGWIQTVCNIPDFEVWIFSALLLYFFAFESIIIFF